MHALPCASRAAPGDVDPSFLPVLDGPVYAIAVQPDQRIVVGGGFTNVNGISRPYLARLLPDGTPDESFDAGAIPTKPVESLVVDSNGRIAFSFGNRVVRVTSTGKREPTNNFAPIPWHDALFYSQDAQFNLPGKINVLTLDSSGRILVGGQFTRYEATNGMRTTRAYVARLWFDGRLDFSFVPQTDPLAAPELEVRSLLHQPDGKIVVAGWVYEMPSGAEKRLIGIFRLTSTGAIDRGFTNGFANAHHLTVSGAALQADGKIVAMGVMFTNDYIGPRHNFLMRLNADRSTDPTFIESSPVTTFFKDLLVQQRNGKVLVFSGGKTLARYLPDGNKDSTFGFESPTNDFPIRAVAFQSDGRILIGGQLGTNFLARLIGSADARFEAITRQPNQRMQFRLRGETYQPYQLQSSSNLVHWTSGATASSTNGLIEFEHTNSPPRRFFRALQVP
ncbi:MAG TPA: hypothetical protein VFC26_14300 [Verrucomicrobiae bacterium]|nr:hypothetical protein [Verrucomicrobiae bacterium]